MAISTTESMNMALFRFGCIAPVVQDNYPDASACAYYRRVTTEPLTLPNGTSFDFKPKTLEKWTELYKKGGLPALMPRERSDMGTTRTLSDEAIAKMLDIIEKFPRLNATQIYFQLIHDEYIPATVSVAAVQRYIKKHDLRSARNPNIKDRKAFEKENFGEMWQADTCYTLFINDCGVKRRTYLIMILDDHSRLIVGGRFFFNDSAYNFQIVLKDAIATYGIPEILYLDSGSPYKNIQLSFILGSIGTTELHTPVRDGASKAKVERNFRTFKDRWMYKQNPDDIANLEDANKMLADYIREHNITVNSSTKETPMNRFLSTRDNIQTPKSRDWLDECFLNRETRKVKNDATISIDNVLYDVPQQFIGMKVDIRFLPDIMEDAFILYDSKHFLIRKTDKVSNSKVKRNNNLPVIDYSKRGVSDNVQ